MRRFVLISLFVVVLVGVSMRGALSSEQDKPNIVIIMADDLGWGDTGYNGHPELKTPNLDKMAQSGLRMDRFYAAHPLCSPTRGSVLTGRNPARYGILHYGRPIQPQEITIAEALKTAGYRTGHFGKWHVGSVYPGSPVNPSACGFDEWLSAPNFYDVDPLMSRRGEVVRKNGDPSMIAAREAVDFMRRQEKQDHPFFTVVWPPAPHVPHQAADWAREMYPENANEVEWMGEITGLDRAVGTIRSALRDMDVADNTLVWFLSDNGGIMNASTGGRGNKGQIYEGGIRVPSIIEWPEKIPSARSTSMPAVTDDIYPTLLDIVGVSLPDQPKLDGISLLPLIESDMQKRPEPIGFWYYPDDGVGYESDILQNLRKAQARGNWTGPLNRLRLDAGTITKQYPTDEFPGHAAWLDWPWKLHRWTMSPSHRDHNPDCDQVHLELYHLERDPDESKNVADHHPERVKKMRKQLEKWQTSVINSLNGNDY